MLVPGCGAALSADAPGTARWQTRGTGQKELQLCFLTGKKAWWERACPSSAVELGRVRQSRVKDGAPGCLGQRRVWGLEHLLWVASSPVVTNLT